MKPSVQHPVALVRNREQTAAGLALSACILDLAERKFSILEELIRALEEESHEQLTVIQQGLRERDTLKLQSAAHHLRGSIGHFTQDTAYQAARNLELLSQSGDLAEVEAAYRAVAELLDELMATLHKLGPSL